MHKRRSVNKNNENNDNSLNKNGALFIFQNPQKILKNVMREWQSGKSS